MESDQDEIMLGIVRYLVGHIDTDKDYEDYERMKANITHENSTLTRFREICNRQGINNPDTWYFYFYWYLYYTRSILWMGFGCALRAVLTIHNSKVLSCINREISMAPVNDSNRGLRILDCPIDRDYQHSRREFNSSAGENILSPNQEITMYAVFPPYIMPRCKPHDSHSRVTNRKWWPQDKHTSVFERAVETASPNTRKISRCRSRSGKG